MAIQPLPRRADPQAARRNWRIPTITTWDPLPLVLSMDQVRQILGLSRDSTYALAFRLFGWGDNSWYRGMGCGVGSSSKLRDIRMDIKRLGGVATSVATPPMAVIHGSGAATVQILLIPSCEEHLKMLYQYTTPRSCAEVSLPNASPVRENPETYTTLSATVKRLLVFMLIRLWHLSPDLGAAAGRLVVRYWPPFRGA